VRFFIFSAFSILKSFRFSLSVIVLLENSSLFNSVKKILCHIALVL